MSKSSQFELDTYHAVDNHAKEVLILRKAYQLLRKDTPTTSALSGPPGVLAGTTSALSGPPGVLGQPVSWSSWHASIVALSQPALLATEPCIGPDSNSIPIPRFLFGYTLELSKQSTEKHRCQCRPLENKVPHPNKLVDGRDKLRDSSWAH